MLAVRSGRQIDKAVGYLYRNYYRMLENYILTNSGNKLDAEDLIQEVMIAFIELIQQEKFRGDSSVKTFLFALTRNMWISELRKRSSEARRVEAFEKDRDMLEEDVVGYLMHREAQQTVVSLFEKLGETCRKILSLFYYENLSMKEILEQTDYENEQVVRNKKYKCLKELTDLVHQSPTVYDNVKSALQRFK